MGESIVVLVTASSTDEAVRLAEAVVGEQLAACVNVVPGVRSIYRWQGEVCNEAEVLLVIKSTRAAYPALEKQLVELHSYDVPEVIALPIDRGSPQYLAWLAGQVDID